MDAFLIEGPNRLRGEVEISGSKNTALPFLFASLLFDKPVEFENVPRLWDIETTLALLTDMGSKTHWDKETSRISIDPRIHTKLAPYEFVKKMRAGILALGPLVAKYGEAKVSLPGGCAIGARPVNYHLEAMKKMGVAVEVEGGYVKASVLSRLKGATISFPDVTVTGTENLLYLAAFAEGETVLENAACEPEVVALGELLQDCGIEISGLGTPTVRIQGGTLREPSRPIRVPADRIEAGTWIAISMATGSELRLKNLEADCLTEVIRAYTRMGLGIEVLANGTALQIHPKDRYEPLSLETTPYPGFPTDMQAQILANTTQATGVSHIRENIFENRFMHVNELQRLGAQIEVEGNLARVTGPKRLRGAPLMATDLRASASLVVAALMAEGTTKISRIYHLDRGYQRLDLKLQALGAKVTRVAE